MISIVTDTPSFTAYGQRAPFRTAIPGAPYLGTVASAHPKTNRARGTRARMSSSRLPRARAQPVAFGHVVLIQFAAAVDSLCPCPGFGQFGGAVMLRIGIVITRLGSQVENWYSGRSLLNPITASLYPW